MLGGWVRHNAIRCDGQADPDQVAPGSFAAGATWAPFGQVSGASFSGGYLAIEDTQFGAGWALLSHQVHDHTKPLRLVGLVELQPDPGAWLGLALIGDESDYRELALYEAAGALRLGLWAPCYWRDLAPVQPGPRMLALEWRPGKGWAYQLDGATVATEAADHLGAALVQPARAGVYAVNIGAESRRLPSGLVRGTVGPLTVESIP